MAYALDDLIGDTTGAFLDVAKTGGYEPLFVGADSHGALEWRAVRRDPTFRRYIVLGVWVFKDTDGEPFAFDIELSVGISDDRSFGKQLVAREHAQIEPQHVVRRWADDWLEAARQMTPDQMTTLYQVPRDYRDEVSL